MELIRKGDMIVTKRPANSAKNAEFQQPVTVANSGSQSITDPEGKEREEEVEQEQEYQYYGPRIADTNIHDENAEKSAEIALANNQALIKDKEDLKIRLNEAFVLIEDKDRELDRIRLAMGELELQIRDLKKNPPKNIDEKEELQIKYDELKIAYEELKAVESLRVQKQDFKPASNIQSPPKVWVAAINALNLYRGLNEASKYAIEHNDPWKKVLFDITDNGQLKNARLEAA